MSKGRWNFDKIPYYARRKEQLKKEQREIVDTLVEMTVPRSVLTTANLDDTLKNFRNFQVKNIINRLTGDSLTFEDDYQIIKIEVGADTMNTTELKRLPAPEVIEATTELEDAEINLEDFEPEEPEELTPGRIKYAKSYYEKNFTIDQTMTEIMKAMNTLADDQGHVCITEFDLGELIGIPRTSVHVALVELVRKRKLAIIKEKGRDHGRTYLVINYVREPIKELPKPEGVLAMQEASFMSPEPDFGIETMMKLQEYVEGLEAQLEEKTKLVEVLEVEIKLSEEIFDKTLSEALEAKNKELADKDLIIAKQAETLDKLTAELERYRNVAGFFSKRIMKD